MFKSCSAYQESEPAAIRGSRPEILYLSHCVPNPPDKGERIRACHELRHLVKRYRVHLVCFARSAAEVAAADALRSQCASVHAELLHGKSALLRAGLQFLMGSSLTTAFYGNGAMWRQVARLRPRIAATVAFSSAMAPYAPEGIPLLLDMVDVDSQKWFEYARLRTPALPYRMEGARLERLEIEFARRAQSTIVTTAREQALLHKSAPGARVAAIENGVDCAHFDPALFRAAPSEGRTVAFVGAMGYYPNADAVKWYATEVHREARRRDPRVQFTVVGRDPVTAVRNLSSIPGVTVTGTVADVRPYLAAASAVVAPLRIARGIQNKVLEALAMGKRVLASPAVCATFGSGLPDGIVRCDTRDDYLAALESCEDAAPDMRIRDAAARRFSWGNAMRQLDGELGAILTGRGQGGQR